MNVSKRLIFLRKLHNKSQEQASSENFISRAHLSNIENGIFTMTDEIRTRMAKYYNVPIGYLENRKKDASVEGILKHAYETLLHNKLSDLEGFLAIDAHQLEVSQELTFRMLENSYFYMKLDFENTAANNDFISIYKKDIKPEKKENLQKKVFYYYLNHFYYADSLYEDCLKYLEKLERLEVKRNKARVMVIKAQMLYSANRMDETMRAINNAIDYIQKLDIPLLLCSISLLKSSVFIMLKLYREALVVLDGIENTVREHGIEDHNLLAGVYQHKGFLYFQTNENDMVLGYYEKSRKLTTNPEAELVIAISIAIHQIFMGNLETAKETIASIRQSNIREYEEMILLSLECEMHLLADSFDECRNSLKKVLSYFEKNNFTNDLSYIYSYLSKYYSKKRKYKEAYKYLQLKEELKLEG